VKEKINAKKGGPGTRRATWCTVAKKKRGNAIFIAVWRRKTESGTPRGGGGAVIELEKGVGGTFRKRDSGAQVRKTWIATKLGDSEHGRPPKGYIKKWGGKKQEKKKN